MKREGVLSAVDQECVLIADREDVLSAVDQECVWEVDQEGVWEVDQEGVWEVDQEGVWMVPWLMGKIAEEIVILWNHTSADVTVDP